jgi:hypothetical protein
MKTLRTPTIFVLSLSVLWTVGCADSSSPQTAKAQPVAGQTPTPTALWASRQVDTLLASSPDTLPLLAGQLRALNIIEGGDPDAALPMDLRPEEMESLWQRVREKYDTEWVRGYMTTGTRAGFVHTLASLYVRSSAPALFEEMPGPFGAEAERWSSWIEEHKAQLGLTSVRTPR